MNNKYQIFLISDSTGETLDRIFLALQSQFTNFDYDKKEFVFVRTEQQIAKILKECNKKSNSIILYTIVDTILAKHLASESFKNNIPCFGVLGNLILSFSKLLNQKATHKPSAQYVLDEDYYKRIEAIQFTMAHDDGKKNEDISKSDIILLGVSRTSKTPTSIYLANRGYKTLNIPLVLDQKIPDLLKTESRKFCIIGLVADADRLSEIRKTRANTNQNIDLKLYTNVDKIKEEVNNSKAMFKKYNWPIIDVTRRSVEETAASIIKIYEIKKINENYISFQKWSKKRNIKKNKIDCDVEPSSIDEDEVKISMLNEDATPTLISKNLAELKANKISNKNPNKIVLGADSVIDLQGELISKPKSRQEALEILKKLNGKKHQLISSVCISRNGSMIWNCTDASSLTMKELNLNQIKSYLKKVDDEKLFAYGVYQIEAGGKDLFSKIEGDEDTIMGLPVKKIKEYLNNLRC